MKKLILIIFAGVFILNGINAQNEVQEFSKDSISPITLSYVKKFNKNERFPYYGAFNGRGYIGPVGSDFFEFRDTATIEELIHIINHKNPIVKAYSFWALIHKEGVDLMPLIKNHINDTTHLKGYFQHNSYSNIDYLLCDFFIEKATLYNPDISTKDRYDLDKIFVDFEVAYSGLSKNQYQELDSLLIFTPNQLAYSKLAFLNLEPNPDYYNELKIKYQNDSVNHALIAIARFNKKEDLELINNELSPLIKLTAINVFPDEYFIPFLLDYGDSIIQKKELSIMDRLYYNTLSNYDDDRVRKLLTSLAKADLSWDHKKYLYSSICDSIRSEYSDLYLLFYNSHDIIDIDVFVYLCQNKLIDCTKKLKGDLWNSNKNHFKSDIAKTNDLYRNSCMGISDCEIQKLTQLLLQLDSITGKKVVINNLKVCHNSHYNVFTKIASKIKDSEMADVIIKRMRKTDNAYKVNYSLDALLQFGDETITKIALEIIDSKEAEFEEWHIELLSETMKKHKINWK